MWNERMGTRLGIVCIACLLLAGCDPSLRAMQTNAADMWAMLRGSMSGATVTMSGTVQQVQDTAYELRTEMEERTGKVQSGLTLLQRGRQLFIEGIFGSESSQE
ncbi:MAG: hypothetical protein WCX29_00815 [Candidatus Peribacteraceae bacterium]